MLSVVLFYRGVQKTGGLGVEYREGGLDVVEQTTGGLGVEYREGGLGVVECVTGWLGVEYEEGRLAVKGKCWGK